MWRLKRTSAFCQILKEIARTTKQRTRIRKQDLKIAIADTIRILNDGDALELLKKTLLVASFVQMTERNAAAANRAKEIIKRVIQGHLVFIMLALPGKIRIRKNGCND